MSGTKKLSRSEAGRLGGLATAARHHPADYTAAARRGLDKKFAGEVDPDGSLRKADPAEFARRFEARRREFYARLARAGVEARRRRCGAS